MYFIEVLKIDLFNNMRQVTEEVLEKFAENLNIPN